MEYYDSQTNSFCWWLPHPPCLLHCCCLAPNPRKLENFIIAATDDMGGDVQKGALFVVVDVEKRACVVQRSNPPCEPSATFQPFRSLRRLLPYSSRPSSWQASRQRFGICMSSEKFEYSSASADENLMAYIYTPEPHVTHVDSRSSKPVTQPVLSPARAFDADAEAARDKKISPCSLLSRHDLMVQTT